MQRVKGLNTNAKHLKNRTTKIKDREAGCLSCVERGAKRLKSRKSLRKCRS